ncbi:MAG: very short patch repair endonuclease [Ardenticatenaceae bacterium]|nr:MAG: very short patch repair endonuclease [Ardenticatenaceae bacterium]
MTDVVDRKTRSRMMSGIRGKDTKLELIIRKRLHALGFRYKLHNKQLPGKPDMVFPKYKAVILVNGCFWHGHNCHLFKWPSTREKFWRNKITRTKEKDKENIERLLSAEWRILQIWECAIKGKEKIPIDKVIEKCSTWLESSQKQLDIRGISKKEDA